MAGSGVQLHFSSQGSQDEATATESDLAIVYDSQEPDDDPSLTPEAIAALHQPINLPAGSHPSLSLNAPSLHPVTHQTSLLNALARSSSIASAVSLSQCEDYCTPLDQPVKQRSDEERALDILNARQKLMAACSSSSSSTSPPAPVSVNIFLPYPLRHSPSVDVFPSTLPPPTSRLLTDYVVLRVVGEGSFGCVLQCRHRLDGALYAVKRIKRVMGGKGGLHELRECWAMSAVMAGGMTPPSLLRYHSSWWEDGQLHIATEWCEGPTLAQTLTRPHSAEEVEAMLAQVAAALRHLHRLGMAHLDVKPDNILVLSPSPPIPLSPPLYKLIDYGLMHPLSSHPQSLSSIGDRRYVPAYAVEHEDDAEGLDRVDVYGLGVVGLEMWLGRRLDDGERGEVRQGRVDWVEAGGGEGGGLRGRLGEVLGGMVVVDMWQRMDADDVVRRLQVDDEGGGVGGGDEVVNEAGRGLGQRVGELLAEVSALRERVEVSERERDVAKERAAQLDVYVQQVRQHMARLHI